MKARQLIDAEDPKHFLQHVAPPANFEVDGKWQAWAADGAGNVLYSMEAQHTRRAKLTSIKKFNVEEYHERNGKWPKGQIKLDHISYWDWRGRYFACGGEVYSRRRPRQEAEDPKGVLRQARSTPLIPPNAPGDNYYVQFAPVEGPWMKGEVAPFHVYDDGQCEFRDGLYDLTAKLGEWAGEDEEKYVRAGRFYTDNIIIDVKRGQTDGTVDGPIGVYKWRLLKPNHAQTHFRYIPYHSTQVLARPRSPKGWDKMEAEDPKAVFREMQRKCDKILRDAGFELLSATRSTTRWYLRVDGGYWMATVEKSADGSEWWEMEQENDAGAREAHREGWGTLSLSRALDDNINVLEAEDPKQVFKHHLTRPEDVSIRDMDIIHRENPNYPVYTYSAMWKFPFMRAHKIVGCPAGSGETLYKAMRDLVDSTNRESKLKLCLTFPNTPDHMVFNYKVGIARVPEPQEEAEDPKQFLQRIAPQPVVVSCYMGHWTADRRTGMVKRWHPDANSSDDPEFARWAASRVAFDFDEWEKHWGRPADREIDICDIGSWGLGGEYEPPEEEYRKEERARQQ